MEATAVARGGPMPIPPPQQSRKEWRAVSDHHLVRNVGDEVTCALVNPPALACVVAEKKSTEKVVNRI